MPRNRRGNLCSRIASLERDVDLPGIADRPQVTLYMPRKDGDTQPCGVITETRWFRMILYDAKALDPTLSLH